MGLPEHCPIESECLEWTYRYFGDCVCNYHDEISFYFGLLSIFCWGIAEIPQIIANWKAGNSEGVSLAFILTWTVGDVFNLVGCLMDPVTLPTQFYTAVMYTTTTLVLVGQHIWYGRRTGVSQVHAIDFTPNQDGKGVARLMSWESSSLEGLFPSDPTLADGTKIPGVNGQRRGEGTRTTSMASSVPSSRQQSPSSYTGSWRRLTLSTSYGTSPRLRVLLVAALISGGLGMGTPFLWGEREKLSSVDSKSFVLGTGRKLLQVVLPSQANFPKVLNVPLEETELRDVVGQILGWAMTCIYLTGRLPQIILNITRGTVEGLSWSMFAFAIGGNATYLASILTRSLDWRKLKPNMPWLVDSACCLAMDFCILGQCLYYSIKTNRQNKRDGYTALQ